MRGLLVFHRGPLCCVCAQLSVFLRNAGVISRPRLAGDRSMQGGFFHAFNIRHVLLKDVESPFPVFRCGLRERAEQFCHYLIAGFVHCRQARKFARHLFVHLHVFSLSASPFRAVLGRRSWRPATAPSSARNVHSRNRLPPPYRGCGQKSVIGRNRVSSRSALLSLVRDLQSLDYSGKRYVWARGRLRDSLTRRTCHRRHGRRLPDACHQKLPFPTSGDTSCPGRGGRGGDTANVRVPSLGRWHLKGPRRATAKYLPARPPPRHPPVL